MRQYVRVKADDHAMKELPDARLDQTPLEICVEGNREQMKELDENFHTTALLHSLCVGEAFACSAENINSHKYN